MTVQSIGTTYFFTHNVWVYHVQYAGRLPRNVYMKPHEEYSLIILLPFDMQFSYLPSSCFGKYML